MISVLVQAYYTGETIIDVGPNAFNPPPKVNSSVIRLKRRENFELSCDDRLFRTVVKTSFSQRRKMLRNTLKPLIQDLSILDDPFFTQRPEQLGVKEFVDITNRIKNQNKID